MSDGPKFALGLGLWLLGLFGRDTAIFDWWSAGELWLGAMVLGGYFMGHAMGSRSAHDL